MVNKLEFNNLVITNKKQIQRVKALTTQKLIQKIKKLKYSLEKKTNNERNKERLGKATLSLEDLKKLKCTDLMKQVLLLDKTPSAILTNGRSSPEELAIAMVAVNKTMQEMVKTFEEKLELTAGNKTWRKELMQQSKRQIKIQRTEKKRKSRQELKEQKLMARKREEWLKNQNEEHGDDNTDDGKKLDECDEEDEEGANVSTLGYWKIEPIDDLPPGQKLKKEKNYKNDKSSAKTPTKIKAISVDNLKNVQNAPKQTSKLKLQTNDHKKKIVTNTSVESTNGSLDLYVSDTGSESDSSEDRLWSLQQKELEPMTEHTKASTETPAADFEDELKKEYDSSDKQKLEEITHVIDPFFITESGEHYRSTAVVIRNGQVILPKPIETNDMRPRPLGNYGKRVKPFNVDAVAKGNTANRNRHKTPKESNVTNLHPSWAAKQRLKPIIVESKGKKIKFDEFDNNTAKQNQIKRSQAEPAENLHPSWAAKQKMKASITEFKGKKIVFGNDEEKGAKVMPSKKITNELNETASGLHPSWAAKQKQKSAITAFQGKKITFENND